MPCTCKILYQDNNNILLKYQHGCPEHEDWCRDESHRRYIRATDSVLMCECGRRAFIEEAVHSTSTNTGSPKLLDELTLLIDKERFVDIRNYVRCREIITQLRASA